MIGSTVEPKTVLSPVESFADTVGCERMLSHLAVIDDPTLHISAEIEKVYRGLLRMFGPGSGSHDTRRTQPELAAGCGVKLRSFQRHIRLLRRLLIVGWRQRPGRHHRLSSNDYWLSWSSDVDDLGRLNRPHPAEAEAEVEVEPIVEPEIKPDPETEPEIVAPDDVPHSLCSATLAEQSPSTIETTIERPSILDRWLPSTRPTVTPRVLSKEAQEKADKLVADVREERAKALAGRTPAVVAERAVQALVRPVASILSWTLSDQREAQRRDLEYRKAQATYKRLFTGPLD